MGLCVDVNVGGKARVPKVMCVACQPDAVQCVLCAGCVRGGGRGGHIYICVYVHVDITGDEPPLTFHR